MEVFKTKQPMRILSGYNRYDLLANQLVKTSDVKLQEFFRGNSNFEPIVDDVLIKLAPDVNQIIPVEDPIRMRKEDIINELRRYKISVDVYSFSDHLSQQLILARKLLKRNFVTVLDRKGRPTFIDDVDLPVPATENDEKYLSEPEEPKLEKIKPVTVKEEFKLQPTTAMSVVESKDEIEEINKGDSYEDFVKNIIDGKHPIIDERQKKIDDFLKKQEEENLLKQQELTRERRIHNDSILPENYAYFVDYTKFCKKEFFTDKEKEEFKFYDGRKISIDAYYMFVRYYGIEYTESDDMQQNRWFMGEVVRKFVEDDIVNKEHHTIELNVLQNRVEEIEKFQPSFNSCTMLVMKRKIEALQKHYGANVWLPQRYMLPGSYKNFAAKMFQVVKLGLRIPSTEEELNELLIKHKKFNLVKTINNDKDVTVEENNGETV